MTQALMLQPPWAIEDVIERGLRVNAKDGEYVMVMDKRFHFATFNARDGLVREPVSGPFAPPP